MEWNGTDLTYQQPCFPQRLFISNGLHGSQGTDSNGPTRVHRMRPLCPWTSSWLLEVLGCSNALCRDAAGLFDDRKAHAGLVAVFFRYRAPGIFGLLAGRERALDLGRAVHQRVEIHRTELATNHPVTAAVLHDSLLLFSRLNMDVGTVRLELRGLGRVVQRRGR